MSARRAATAELVLVQLAAPRGFGAAYRRAAQEPASPAVLESLLGLVGYSASAERIAGWPLVKRVEAEVHGYNQHLRACGNPIQRHPRPAWMPEPWLGAPQGEGVFESPAGTPL